MKIEAGEEETKVCSGKHGCGLEKNLKKDFHRRAVAADGYHNICKECVKLNNRGYYKSRTKPPPSRKRLAEGTRLIRRSYDFDRYPLPDIWVKGLEEIRSPNPGRGFQIMWDQIKGKEEDE